MQPPGQAAWLAEGRVMLLLLPALVVPAVAGAMFSALVPSRLSNTYGSKHAGRPAPGLG